MQFTYVDAIVAAVTLLSAFLAWSRGFTREVFAIGGWILAAIIAFYLAPLVAPLVAEIPVVGAKLADSCLILMIAAFSLVVAVALLILAVFTPIFASVVLESALGPLDRALGFLFGIARGIVLVAVGYLVYASFAGQEEFPAHRQRGVARHLRGGGGADRGEPPARDARLAGRARQPR